MRVIVCSFNYANFIFCTSSSASSISCFFRPILSLKFSLNIWNLAGWTSRSGIFSFVEICCCNSIFPHFPKTKVISTFSSFVYLILILLQTLETSPISKLTIELLRKSKLTTRLLWDMDFLLHWKLVRVPLLQYSPCM